MKILQSKNELDTGIDKQGFEQLFNTYYDELYRYIYYRAGDQDFANDIVQDTFVKIWELKNSIRINTARALMYKMAGNLMINRIKKQKLGLKFQQTLIESTTFETPEFEMEVKEFDKKLQDVLARLNEKSRVVFLMNRIDQLTYTEIANNLGLSVKAVEKRMKKALEFLKIEIEQKV